MRKYWFLFGLQTLGAAIVIWKGVPFYRNFLSGDSGAGNQNRLWAFAAITLIQPAYWWVRNHMPEIGKKNHSKIVLGHAVLFLGRLIFVFVGGLFSAVFYARQSELHFTSGIFFLIALLFSMFCYTMELERISKRLID